jgi:CBS domain-containing protein
MADADESEIEIPQELREVADKLSRGEALPPITVRELLRYFGARRRGFYIVLWIQEVLESLALRTEPDFRDLWIDGEIKLVKASTAESAGVESGAEPGGDSAVAASDSGGAGAGQGPPNGSPPEPDRPLGPDPTLRVETLDAANRGVLSVKPDEPISLAITRMLVNNYSQLPVMPNPRTAKGIVSWATIGPGISMNNQGAAVRHHMQKASIVDYDDTFLDVLPTIIDKGYVLVRGRDGSITGIVTASDVSVEFQKRAEPFLLLSEIEQHIRNLIEGKLSTEELRSVKNPADTSRVSMSFLT